MGKKVFKYVCTDCGWKGDVLSERGLEDDEYGDYENTGEWVECCGGCSGDNVEYTKDELIKIEARTKQR